MKDRPLPPPPRPDRTLPRRKKDQKEEPKNPDPNDEDDQKPDRDGGAERIAVDHQLNATQQLSIEEQDTSTQTEPLPEEAFESDELEITPDMRTITPTQSKTLEDILKEEQEAEFERAQQQVAESNLTRGLQRFRDANQRSMSEKSWASRDRPKTPSGHMQMSPNASALRMNIDQFIERERGVDQEEEMMRMVDEEDIEMNRNMVEDEEKEANDKILNLEVGEGEKINPVEETAQPTSDNENHFDEHVETEIERQAQRLEDIIDRLSSEGSPPPVQQPMVSEKPPIAPPRRKSSIEDPKNVHLVDSQTTDTANALRTNALINVDGSVSQELIDQITERILNSEQMQNRNASQSVNSSGNPAAPPGGFFAIPTEYLNSLAPPSFYQLRDPEEKTITEEKVKTKITESDPKEGSSTEEPSVLRLGGELMSACGSAFMRNVREFMAMIPSSLSKEESEGAEGSTRTARRDINVILLILIIIIVCLLAFAMGGSRTVHHHHWDFFNPPGADKLD